MYFREADYRVLAALSAVARERGETPPRVALAWLLAMPGVSAPIVGATKVAHLADLAAAVDLTLSPAEIARLEAPYEPHPVLGFTGPSPRDMARPRPLLTGRP
jgi:aryl-alcohol dehydrogenase (NADP+)